MWRILAQGNVPENAVKEALLFLRNLGLTARAEEVNVIFGQLDLVQHLLSVDPAPGRNLSDLRRLQLRGFKTLNDLTKVSFEEFWIIFEEDRAWTRSWKIELLRLMAAHEASFTDADPRQLLVRDIKKGELSTKLHRSLERLKIDSSAMLSSLPARYLLGKRVRGVGREGLSEIRVMLRRRGLTLKGE